MQEISTEISHHPPPVGREMPRRGKRPETRRELTDYMKEQINNALLDLQKGQQITVVYYEKQEQQTAQITGTVMKVDAHWQTMHINQVSIDFQEIYEIHET